MAAQWYWAKNGEQRGPIDTEALKQLALSGELAPSDLVWREGLANWIPASQAKELFDNAGVSPAPVMALPATPAPATAYQGAATPVMPYYSPMPARSATCGYAVAALVLGLIPCTCVPSLLAVIFGHIALSKINASQGQLTGRGMAIAGLVLGYVFTALNVLWGIFSGIIRAGHGF